MENKINKEFLILGHPRGGTGYATKLFKIFGFDIGHEIIKSSGICSWYLSHPKGWNVYTDRNQRNQFDFNYTFLAIRHPLQIINSTIKENQGDGSSLGYVNFLTKHQFTSKNEIDLAAERFLLWDSIIWKHNQIDFIFKVEEDQLLLFEFLASLGLEPYFFRGKSNINPHIISRDVNTRSKNYKNITLDDISPDLRNKVKEKIRFYGYK